MADNWSLWEIKNQYGINVDDRLNKSRFQAIVLAAYRGTDAVIEAATKQEVGRYQLPVHAQRNNQVLKQFQVNKT